MIHDFILGVFDSLPLIPLRRQMVNNLQNVSYKPVLLRDFDWVDTKRLEAYQCEFEKLGFGVQGDFTPQLQAHGVTGFMRLMSNEREQAHVSLHTSKSPLSASETLRCSIICPLSEGWAIFSNDREADAILYQLRLPRTIGLRDCDTSPTVLWQETLAIRNLLMHEKELHPVEDTSAEAFKVFMARFNGELAELLQKKNIVQFAVRRRALMRDKPPRRELWTGEWTPANSCQF